MSYKILSKKQLAPKETLFEVDAPDVAAKARPGQFLIIIAREGGERVPLTISDYDAQRGSVSFAFHEVGDSSDLSPCGDFSGLAGICGQVNAADQTRLYKALELSHAYQTDDVRTTFLK